MKLQGAVNLPEEMKKIPQWAIAGPDGNGGYKAPYAISSTGSLIRVGVNTKEPLLTFGAACELQASLLHQPTYIGFILRESDPFTCIDLDFKEGTTTVEQLERFNKIVDAFDSYTEVSQSGKGVHVWVKGSIGAGARRDGVEVYSRDRFIVCTGNIMCDKPIADRNELLEVLVREIRGSEPIVLDLEEEEQYWEDYEIFEMATEASNSEKFNALCRGEWAMLNYPSQSEADLSLMSMFAFYSECNSQCRRLFRMTELGKREKAIKNDRYLDYALRVIRSRQAAEKIALANAEKMSIAIAQQLQAAAQEIPAAVTREKIIHDNHLAQEQALEKLSMNHSMDYPPGLAGDIARFIYHSSPRPVREVSIVASIGFLAGLCGKAFHIPQSGLNIYMILIARSAIGKEAMHGGISHIISKLRESVPSISNFVNFSDFASGPALIKACAEQPSFVNVAGEWGKKLARLSKEDRTDGPMQQLRTVMTNLYQKSGPNSIAGGINYSNKDNNVISVSGVAYSMIGETTPGTFYEALTESMMEDGFLSRFNIVEYNGDRPAANKFPVTELPPELAERLSALAVYAATLLARYTHCAVTYSAEVQRALDNFDIKCDREINSTTDESYRQMWNRAHLKVCRLSALLAVADNHIMPIVQMPHFEWALALVKRDIVIMSSRIANGDVGTGDATREKKVLQAIAEYLQFPVGKSYNVPEEMRELGIVPRRYLQLKLGRLSTFLTHKNGSSWSLDQTLKSLCDSGYLSEIEKAKLEQRFGSHGRCFRVLINPKG